MTAKTLRSVPGGKLTAMLAEDQFSMKREQTRRKVTKARIIATMLGGVLAGDAGWILARQTYRR
jgi:hypothetical protein